MIMVYGKDSAEDVADGEALAGRGWIKGQALHREDTAPRGLRCTHAELKRGVGRKGLEGCLGGAESNGLCFLCEDKS